jgi:polysaccharide export outer membrane protein
LPIAASPPPFAASPPRADRRSSHDERRTAAACAMLVQAQASASHVDDMLFDRCAPGQACESYTTYGVRTPPAHVVAAQFEVLPCGPRSRPIGAGVGMVRMRSLLQGISGTNRGAVAVLLLLAAALLAGCSTPQYPPAPATAAASDYVYHVGPLDTVNVIVWRNPELSMSVPVRPDGQITTPLVDDLPALGKTPSELERDIEKALSKFIRDPVVTVVVSKFVGPINEQVRVIGEATKPQVLPYSTKMTVLDVMIAVGGLTDFADGNGARIFRVADGGKLYSVRLKDLVKRGDITANVEMMPGDILIIPQSWF